MKGKKNYYQSSWSESLFSREDTSRCFLEEKQTGRAGQDGISLYRKNFLTVQLVVSLHPEA